MGDPLRFSKVHFVAKYQKIEGGPFGDKSFRKKKSHSAEKNSKWDPIVPSDFVSYVKNWVHARGRTLCTNLDAFSLAGPVVQ